MPGVLTDFITRNQAIILLVVIHEHTDSTEDSKRYFFLLPIGFPFHLTDLWASAGAHSPFCLQSPSSQGPGSIQRHLGVRGVDMVVPDSSLVDPDRSFQIIHLFKSLFNLYKVTFVKVHDLFIFNKRFRGFNKASTLNSGHSVR